LFLIMASVTLYHICYGYLISKSLLDEVKDL
jgi:hypothetical protein